MPSDQRTPCTPRKHTAREKRALIACTRCRHLKKRCKQECGALSPRGRCRRCRTTGEVCQYLNVVDDIPSHVPSPPPTDLCVHMEELVQQSSSSSGSSTHETEDVSNHSHGTHPDGIFYPLIWVDPVAPADPSLSPSYASRSATESPQYDWRPPIPTTTFSTSDVYAQRPNSPNYHDYHDITNPILPLSTQYEVSRSQSNIPARMASNYYTPYDTTNQEANTSDPRSPHGGWDSYHASSDNQVPSARSDHPR